jgi:hypothetical protein
MSIHRRNHQVAARVSAADLPQYGGQVVRVVGKVLESGMGNAVIGCGVSAVVGLRSPRWFRGHPVSRREHSWV